VSIFIIKSDLCSHLWSPKLVEYDITHFPSIYPKYIYGAQNSLTKIFKKSFWRDLWSPILSFRSLKRAASDTSKTFFSNSSSLILLPHWPLPTALLSFCHNILESHLTEIKPVETGLEQVCDFYFSYLSLYWCYFPTNHLLQSKSFYIGHQYPQSTLICFVLFFERN